MAVTALDKASKLRAEKKMAAMNSASKDEVPESMKIESGTQAPLSQPSRSTALTEQGEEDFDGQEGLKLLKRGYELDLTKREVNKLMRIAKVALEKVDTKSRKSVDLPTYIENEVEEMLNNFKRTTGVKVATKDYIIALICKDLISRGIFEDVRALR
jgi:hypothetical protein